MESKRNCPHCSERAIPVARIGGNVVAIMHCPCKEELLLFYRDKVIPLKRSILESGTFEERKEHLGTIAANIFEMGMSAAQNGDFGDILPSLALPDGAREQGNGKPHITPEEFDKFVRIDLKCLDNAAYFRRHFG